MASPPIPHPTTRNGAKGLGDCRPPRPPPARRHLTPPAPTARTSDHAGIAEHDDAPPTITYSTAPTGASEVGDLAYEIGMAVGPDGPSTYLTVYRRTAAGWRIVADSWSDDAPTTGAD